MNKKNKNLTRSLKNDRNNKDLLRTEINNSTDPNVRLELTKMLVNIEKEEKKKKAIKWTICVFIIILIPTILLYVGNQPTKKINVTKNPESSSSINQQLNSSNTTESFTKETNLSEQELKEWVMAILNLTTPPPTKYILTVNVNDKDNLAYIHVGIDQLDGFGTFRVNAKGQLEFMPYMGQFSGNNEWIVISNKYMDTSIAKDYFAEQLKSQAKSNDDLNITKKQLIGKTYIIKPILYDGIDVEQAMNNNKAPQNLIHDGVQIITFKDNSTVHIELAGTYRPDYDESYSLSPNTINIKDYYIPYKYNYGNISFDTWTTDTKGHTITWAISPQ
ncbi:hypothetical protein [Vagococcus sp. CY53-2]|uniref:hypothetical protein n=1 Tax=Vagococcus sp. CY53-2 TaxID=2925780 RepID=UPI001F50804B|nr:hypothetical protein [Vagococcus sp. CY53-2]